LGATLLVVVASLFMVPITALIVVMVAVFGPWIGGAGALVGAMLSAAAGFGAGRYLWRGRSRRLQRPRLRRLADALTDRGLISVAVVRMLPVAPFTLVNLIAGASEIRTRDYLLGSLIGMAPGIVLMTLVGDRLGAWLRHPDVANLAVVVGLAAVALALAWALRRWSIRRTRA
jgi:uncharacterized membrane protein YdjX (TVP38/TMEM64 family)